jgi:hypothetical protein
VKLGLLPVVTAALAAGALAVLFAGSRPDAACDERRREFYRLVGGPWPAASEQDDVPADVRPAATGE